MTRWMLTAAALAVSSLALAKLPPPDDAAKAKAAEAAAKAAWQAKVAAFELCKTQDRIAARYKGNHPAEAKAQAQAPTTKAAASAPSSPASSTGGPATPVANVAAAPVTIPPCADPGPFAATPPEQKPLETSEAHSPAGTATSPPSVRPESAKMTPAKPSTAGKP